MTSTRRQLIRELATSVAAGVVATVPMSGVMLASAAAGRMGTQPPRRVVDEAAEHAGARPSGTTRSVAAAVLHLLMGGVLALGILPLMTWFERVVDARARGAAAGGVFGALVYALNYAGLAPALGILPPPSRDRPGRQLTMIVAHLVYGVVAGVLMGLMRRGTSAVNRGT
jgi:hypothetical protein